MICTNLIYITYYNIFLRLVPLLSRCQHYQHTVPGFVKSLTVKRSGLLTFNLTVNLTLNERMLNLTKRCYTPLWPPPDSHAEM